MSFSSRLKSLRSNRHLSQAALAEILGVTQQAVGKWEVDKATPDYGTLCNISKFFQVSTDYLLGRANAPSASPEPPASSAPPLTPQDKELLCKYHTLTQPSREAVDAVINTYYDRDRPKAEDTAT